MNKLIRILFAFLLCSSSSLAGESPSSITPADSEARPSSANNAAPALTIRKVQYEARLADDEARVTMDIEADAAGPGESVIRLLSGDLALIPPKLPSSLRINRDGDHYQLIATRKGQFRFQLTVVARVQRAEPWNQITFSGPEATIASIAAEAPGAGMELQLLNGTLLESSRSNGVSRIKGFLSVDQTVSLRWQSKADEVARRALTTVESSITAQATPTVMKYTSRFQYSIVQGNVSQLVLTLPADQSLTRISGEQIRDWQINTVSSSNLATGTQLLTIELIKPVEKSYELTLYSERLIDALSRAVPLNPPQPIETERESGALTLSVEDAQAEIESISGLRQVNASGEAIAAYRFNARPFSLMLRLRRVEPVVQVASRVTSRLEETRHLVSHAITLQVEKAGIYSFEAALPEGFLVAEVRGDGVEDWSAANGRLNVGFAARVLGNRNVEVQLERSLKEFPREITVAPLRIAGAARETAQVGAASSAGIRLNTSSLSGLREIPVHQLAGRSDELLAYSSEQPNWQLVLQSERLNARIVADVFNLVTIGDGVLSGSAIVRYGLANQGVQEFRVQVPAHFRNVEFTGPNIRRKERIAATEPADTNHVVWSLGLQDKVWGGYTLVVTYDHPFDPNGATLPIAGIHTREVERETGSIALTTAASLQLNAGDVSPALHRTDETDLATADRALITRAVVLAYQYTDPHYNLAVEVKRYAEERVLEAVADRTQITSVLTESGEMLTQASFMVKNNEKQFQRFLLPAHARLWSCHVNGTAARPERDGDWILVSLPRDANRDQAFAVDIVYAQTNHALAGIWSRSLALTAPRTDVPNTYAEWQLFVPPALRLSSFGGSMTVPQGTTYDLLDAWQKFIAFYIEVLREAGGAILVIGVLAFLVIALVISAARRGWNGIITVLAVVAILGVLSAMLLPALSKAKSKAQRISSVNNLKQIGLAVRIFAGDNGDRLPASFEEMRNELGTDKITYDPETGQRYTYIGAGLSEGDITPDSVIAYGPLVNNHCAVLYADGSVQTMTANQFNELNQRGLIVRSGQDHLALQQERRVMGQQMPVQSPAFAPATPAAVGGLQSEADTRYVNGFAGVAEMPRSLSEPVTGVAGIRSLRIEIPQSGVPLSFTKVLNVGNEPLSIQARVMKLRTFQTVQMLWQTAAFLLGLAIWWWQWRHARNTFALTIALALIFGSVASLLIQWRALHDALIIGFPALLVAAIAFLVWKYWPRRHASPSAEMPETPAPDNTPPPVVASIAIALLLSVASSTAADSTTSIYSASYSGRVNDRVAVIEATLHFTGRSQGEVLSLFGPEVALQDFKVQKGDAQILRTGQNLSVRLGKSAATTIQIRMLARVTGDVTRRKLQFNIPPALSSQIALTLEQPEADVDFPAAISFKRILAGEKTRVEAVIGSGNDVELLWTPRVKRAAEVAATVFCQNNTLATIGGGVVNLQTTLDYQVTQGELRQARIRIPEGHRVLRVEGAGIRTWEIKSSDSAAPAAVGPAQVVTVDLLKGIFPSWRLTLETERALENLPAEVSIAVPQALDTKRETGLIALRNAEELGLSVESTAGLQRVDAEEFARASGEKADNVQSVFRFSKPEFALHVRAQALQPQIEAVVHNAFRLANDQQLLSATVNYVVKRAGVFTLALTLPNGYRVEQVNGEKIAQWTERPHDSGRLLEITLKERVSGPYVLHVQLAQPVRDWPRALRMEGIHPLNTAKLTGFVSISSESGLAAKTDAFDGLTEIPAQALPGQAREDTSATVASAGSVLAYKFIDASPGPTRNWNLTITTETIEPWVRAEAIQFITLGDTLITGKAQVRFDIANAPSRELRLRVPPEFRNVEIHGPNIRSRTRTGDVWLIELQSRVRGIVQLIATWDQPREATNSVELSGISVPGVERESGWICVSARNPLQVSESAAGDLQRVDVADLPEWAETPAENVVLAYRYVRPGYRLAVNTQRFNNAEVLQTLVDQATLTTVVADDGQTMTELSLSVRNNGRQFLEIELPPGSTVWSAFVAGQPVRPSIRTGRLLLPIQHSGSSDSALSVELTYVGTNSFPRRRGDIGFVSPRFDVPLKNVRWELFLPTDYDYTEFAGTMSREITASAAPQVTSSFSRLEYSRMEQASKASIQAEVKREVSEVKRKLASGNVREANATFNRAKGNYAGLEDAEVRQLEKELQAAQGSNLINAQTDFSLRNNGMFFDTQTVGTAGQLAFRYDAASAEQQWTKLQQAQEMAATRVQPLRVNLPVRGVRKAFVQVLQTELNKPMTIQMTAVSNKAVSWPKRIGFGTASFLALWGVVAMLTRMSRHPLMKTNTLEAGTHPL